MEKLVETIKYVEVEKIVERPIEKIVYRDVEKIVEKIVYRDVEKIVDRPVEKIVYKEVEKLVPIETIKIEIKPGYAIGEVLTYVHRGNEQYTYPRSALKVKLIEDKSVKTNFLRRGNNLIYTHSLSLQSAL